MINSTKKWLLMKSSGVVLVPFTTWFILNFISIYDNDYQEIFLFFSSQPCKFLFSIFIIIAFFHSALTISEIFEDYVENETIKNVANKLLYLFAIIIPLLTLVILFNL